MDFPFCDSMHPSAYTIFYNKFYNSRNAEGKCNTLSQRLYLCDQIFATWKSLSLKDKLPYFKQAEHMRKTSRRKLDYDYSQWRNKSIFLKCAKTKQKIVKNYFQPIVEKKYHSYTDDDYFDENVLKFSHKPEHEEYLQIDPSFSPLRHH